MKKLFSPRNPSKYRGDVTSITYRSWWEFQFMMMLDRDPTVIAWSSEEVMIPYMSPVDGRMHRYYPDFHVVKKNGDKLVNYIIEIKPHNQCIRPSRRRNQWQRTWINECKTFEVNQAKWRAAKIYCKRHGYKFQVISEKHIKSFNTYRKQ